MKRSNVWLSWFGLLKVLTRLLKGFVIFPNDQPISCAITNEKLLTGGFGPSPSIAAIGASWGACSKDRAGESFGQSSFGGGKIQVRTSSSSSTRRKQFRGEQFELFQAEAPTIAHAAASTTLAKQEPNHAGEPHHANAHAGAMPAHASAMPDAGAMPAHAGAMPANQ